MAASAKFGTAPRPSEDALDGTSRQGIRAPLSDPASRPVYGRVIAARANEGFTLLELLVVLVILALLAGLVGPRLFGKIESSKVKTAETQIKMLHGALQMYRLDAGRYPTTAEGLDALVRPPRDAVGMWNGPYMDGNIPVDPWRKPYRYVSPADTLQGFALFSLGADSKEGGEGINGDVGYLPEKPK